MKRYTEQQAIRGQRPGSFWKTIIAYKAMNSNVEINQLMQSVKYRSGDDNTKKLQSGFCIIL